MKIIVVPRIFFHRIKGTIQQEGIMENSNIISINTPEYKPHNFIEEFPPFSEKYWKKSNVCILKFHDYDKEATDVILMSKKDAQKIKRFMNKIDKSKPLYIHCTAGISRSQAVGYVLNLYFNKIKENNINDFYEYENKYRYKRRMNSYVKTLLMQTYGLEF